MATLVDVTGMKLHELHGNPTDVNQAGNTAPYLLINAGLNLSGSRDLGRKSRKWGHFLFSKYFCGSLQTGYLETPLFNRGQFGLANALTISGAPTTSGTGYQRFFAQSFLTMLLSRAEERTRVSSLGLWIPNPRRNGSERVAFWPGYLLREALGVANEWTRLVNVSAGSNTGDGMGIYALFQRRCQVIIASDADADPQIAFDSLTRALVDAEADLGVEVDIDLSMVMPDPETGLSKAHCAIGRIHYPECRGRPNWLVYLKPSLTGNEAAHVLNYRRRSPEFPHESGVDQFFDDDEFEAYRALGDHMAEETFARWILDPDVREALRLPFVRPASQAVSAPRDVPPPTLVWDALRLYHLPFSAAESDAFRELTRTLSELDRLVLAEPGLRWY